MEESNISAGQRYSSRLTPTAEKGKLNLNNQVSRSQDKVIMNSIQTELYSFICFCFELNCILLAGSTNTLYVYHQKENNFYKLCVLCCRKVIITYYMKNQSKAYSFSQATPSTLLTKQTRKKSQHMRSLKTTGQYTLVKIL